MANSFNFSNPEQIHQETGLWRVPKFLSPELLTIIERRILSSEFIYQEYPREAPLEPFEELLCISPSIAWLQYFFTDRDLFQSISDMTGITPLRGLRLRVYKFEPKSNFQFRWHNDMVPNQTRLVGFSINLSKLPYEGGEFTIRQKNKPHISATIHNIGYGDAIFFPVSKEFEHCVQPVTGNEPRITCTGWFLDHL